MYFDTFDIEILVKVFKNTVLSPVFAVFVPMTYFSRGATFDSSIFVSSTIYLLLVCLLWIFNWSSKTWRNLGGPGGRLDWGEQIVLITGGASGIGSLLANTLAVRNVVVVVLDVKPIVTENYNITYYECDVSKWSEVERVAKIVQEEIGHPTVIINNAGVVQGKLLVDLTEEDVKQTMNVNVLSHFWTLKAFLPAMIKAKVGHVITMSSVMGLVGAAQMTDYCASKAALVSLNESLRYELDKRYNTPHIRTSLILPGYVHTPMFSRAPALPYDFIKAEAGANAATNVKPAPPLSAGWFNFLAPSVPPYVVVKEIITAMDVQESREITLPFFAGFVRLVTLLPTWGRDFFQWMSGADYAMKGFTKVSGRRPEEGPVPKIANGAKLD